MLFVGCKHCNVATQGTTLVRLEFTHDDANEIISSIEGLLFLDQRANTEDDDKGVNTRKQSSPH